MWFVKRNSRAEDIQIGKAFKRVHHQHWVETAQVTGLSNDASGIPHVRFKLVIKRSDGSTDEVPRILALQSFIDTYCEAA
jgi:hypothetical protein